MQNNNYDYDYVIKDNAVLEMTEKNDSAANLKKYYEIASGTSKGENE